MLGSAARRETLLWTNAHPREFLQSHLTASLVTPPSVGDLLIQHGFDKEWSTPVPSAQTVFPKFLSRIGSHAYRLHGATSSRGMLQHKSQWAEPNCDIRSLAMGFPRDHLTAAPMTEAVRHRVLGSFIDGNILSWLADALCSSSPTPSTWLASSPTPPAPWTIYLDSGSSSHMWGDLSEFTSYAPHPNGPIWVGGIKAVSYGSGTV